MPQLSNLAGPVLHFRTAILDAWRGKVTADLCSRESFQGGPLLGIFGSLQLLNSAHVREKDKVLLRSVVVGGVWVGATVGTLAMEVPQIQFLDDEKVR